MDNEEQLKDFLECTLTLEYYGVRFEEPKNTIDKIIYTFSVPETSNVKNYMTSDELIKLTKSTILTNLLDILSVDPDNDWMNISEEDLLSTTKFLCKIRTGEHWTKSDGELRIKGLKDKIISGLSYKEV